MDKAHSYYNENDPKAAAWIRELIKQGHIAPGDVDERSIEDVTPDEIKKYTQCHFFAGIGGWSYALRLAGWPDDRPVWTGSCPCQPFSAAGKGKGTADERHLWPAFHWLIAQCRPTAVFGEQVASKAGRDWLATVRSDLEASGYAVGAADLCAAGVGAPHIRQRLYFVADAKHNGYHRQAERAATFTDSNEPDERIPDRDSAAGLVADSRSERRQQVPRGAPANETAHGRARRHRSQPDSDHQPASDGENGDVEHSVGPRLERHAGHGDDGNEPGRQRAHPVGSVTTASGAGFWFPYDLLPCRDGKARPVESGTFPLAHGIPARVGRLRGYGNAIVPQVAAAFIEATELCHT